MVAPRSNNQYYPKYETTSARVKGLVFHPKRYWILASLHNGVIQLWDYEEKILIDKFDEHEGPVRGLDFHRHQPLFVSGGDDRKIKLWNHKSRRCIFTWTGAHEDYIRTTYFHTQNPWIVSASDDQSIRIWNWQSRQRIALLTGHTHYVMCAQFHPTKDLLLSASVDQKLRLWDISALSRSSNQVGGNNDEHLSGLPEILSTSRCSVVDSKEAHMHGCDWCHIHPNSDLCLSSADDNLIKVWHIDSRVGLKELYTLRGHTNCVNCAVFDPHSNHIISASDDKTLRVWNLDTRQSIRMGKSQRHEHDPRYWVVTAHPYHRLYAAGHDMGLIVFKLQKERPKKAMMDTFGREKFDAKFVVVSANKRYQAFIKSNWIKICDGQSKLLTKITEQRKIKSAIWDASGVLIYNTPVHVKYALPDGHCTTILSVNEVLYMTGIKDNKIQCLNRKEQLRQIPIDPREFNFKQAVVRGDRASIMNSLRQLKTLSRAEISFLVKKGFPGLALKYVKDAQSRFPLGIQAFNIEDSLESAIKINKSKCWEILAEAAMQVGHVKAAERAYIELRQPYRLALLYLARGQRDKMFEARALAKNLGDTSSEFMISLLVKDFTKCTQIIRRFYPNLAYTCAVNHGLYELAVEISQDLSEEQLKTLPSLETAYNNEANWMQSTMPDIPSNAPFENWPLLNDDDEDAALSNYGDENEPVLADEADGDWDDDESKLASEHENESNEGEKMEGLDEEAGWSDGEPLEDLMDDDSEDTTETELTKKNVEPKVEEKFTPPNPGPDPVSSWVKSSDIALHHVLAGSFKTAFGLLEKQIGLVNKPLSEGGSSLDSLKSIFREIYLHSRAAYQGSALLPTCYIFPLSKETNNKLKLPAGGYSVDRLEQNDLKECYDLVTKGRFKEAIESFRLLLARCLFTELEQGQADDQEQLIFKIIGICREYILALQVWGERKRIAEKESRDFDDHKRVCELAAYFTELKLPKHRQIVLDQALKVFRAKDRPKEFQKTHAASVIARRLLTLMSPSDAKKKDTIAFAEKIKASYDVRVDQELKLDYDDKNPYDLCAATFTPIYKGNKMTECPLCNAKYDPKYNGDLCNVCQLSEVGKRCAGLRLGFERD